MAQQRVPMRLASSFRHQIRQIGSTTPQYGTVHDIDSATAQRAAHQTPNDIFTKAIHANGPRSNWTREEIAQVYNTPLLELAFAAVRTHVPRTVESQSKSITD